MNKHLKILSISFGIAFALLSAAQVQAVAVSTDYTPLTTVPGVFKQGEVTNPVKILKNLYGFAIGIGSVIGIVMIMYAGFEYMYKESISGKSDAKQRIMNVFLGLAVILGSYILLRTINPALVEFNVNLPSGSGRVAHLSIAQNMSNEARAQTQIALRDSAQLRSEIKKIEDEIAELESLIGTPGEDPTQHDSNVERKNSLLKSLATNKALDSTIRTRADVGTVTTSIDENIYLRAAGQAPSADNLAIKHASALGYFDRQLAELKALDQSNPEVKKATEQLETRKAASVAEFKQQVEMEKVLVQYKNNPPAQQKSYATALVNVIKRDVDTQGRKLRDAGLEPEARQYEERAQVRISALCGANLCGN